jgi:hemin uptake protein HemP
MNAHNQYDFRRPHRAGESFGRTQPSQPLAVRTLTSESLFQRGEHEICIAHGDSLYRLKITRQGKLILNK